MKNTLLIIFCLLSLNAFSQKPEDFGFNKIRITEQDKTIVAEIEPVSAVPKINPGLNYFWYSANVINETQGGYSGKLLNGLYTEYYTNKNLKQQGNFRRGLKDGVWKSWNEAGLLTSTITWRRGFEVTGKRPPIWKRIHLFKKKPKPADSLKNNNK